MYFIFLTGLFLIIYFDASLLRKKDESVYRKTLRYAQWFWGFLIIAPVVLSSAVIRLSNRLEFQKDFWRLILLGSMVILLGYYLFQRRSLRSHSPLVENMWPPPSAGLISDALGVMLCGFFGVALVDVALNALMFAFPARISELSEALISTAFSLLFMIYLINQTVKRYPGQSFKEFVGLGPHQHPVWKVIGLPIFIGCLFAATISYFIINRQTHPETPLREIVESSSSVAPLIGLLIMAILVAPLLEEIIFRGYFYKVIRIVKGRLPAIIAVSAVFGFLHVSQYSGDAMAITMIFILGLVLTILRSVTGTSVASISMHYAFNAGMTVFPVVILMLSNPAFIEYKINHRQLTVQQKEELLLESVEFHPEIFVEAYYELAKLYLKEYNDPRKALEYITKAVDIAPTHTKFTDMKEEILRELGLSDGKLIPE